MIETQALELPPSPRRFWLGALTVAIIGALAAAAIILAFAMRASADDGPAGVINYITDAGEFSVTADGVSVAPVAVSPLHVIPPAQNGEYASPGGTASAFIDLPADGSSWLALRAGTETARLGQLTEPGAPLLFNGDKTAAQSAEGIPLVVRWSPDGHYLAYGTVSGAPFTLHVHDAATNATRDFAVPDGYVGEAAWSPDGRYLATSSYTIDRSHHTVYIWDRLDGSFTKLIDGCHIVWAPDSRNLVLHRDPYAEPGVWIVPVKNSDERSALTEDPSGYPMAWVEEEQ